MRLIILLAVLFTLDAQAQDPLYSEEVIADYSLGIIAFENQNFDASKAHFLRCIMADSTCYEAYYALGNIYYENKEYDQALSQANRAKKLRPFDTKLLVLMGCIYYQMSDYPAAETVLKRALSISGTGADNVYFLARSQQKQSKYNEALANYNTLIFSHPTMADYWYNRGLLQMEMENFEGAQVDLNEAYSLATKPLENIHFYLAKAALELGDHESALAHITEGLKSANTEEKVSLLLLKGTYYRNLGAYEKAELQFNEAYTLQNENPLILTHQAAVLIDLEQYEAAIYKCDAALLLNPNQTEAYFNRGIAHEMIRDVEQACNDWQKAFVLGSQKAIEYLNGPVCNE